jgi:hypothetical protein
MAAYRSSRHEATQYTPNYLMFGREVRAPVDLIYDGRSEPTAVPEPTTYDNYAEELENRLHYAYGLVRDNLQEAARRSKRYYDLKVRSKKYQIGDWVYYYTPRRYVGRQQKWSRNFTSPWLVVGLMDPVNVQIQRSRKQQPKWVHIDKVKPFVADVMPKSWITPEPQQFQQTPNRRPAAILKRGLKETPATEESADTETVAEIEPMAGVLPNVYYTPRPRRQVSRPLRYRD